MVQKKSLCERIHNARTSLANAEESFRANKDVRGELDLMLAEAEMKNLRQKRSTGLRWTRQLLAAACAGLILLGGYGGWWWAHASSRSAAGSGATLAAGTLQTPVAPVLEPQPKQSRTETEPAPEAKMTKASTSMQIDKPAARPAVSEAASTVEPAAPAAAPPGQAAAGSSEQVQLSATQMRQLVRSGRQELSNSK